MPKIVLEIPEEMLVRLSGQKGDDESMSDCVLALAFLGLLTMEVHDVRGAVELRRRRRDFEKRN